MARKKAKQTYNFHGPDESGLNGRSHTGFADQGIAFSVLLSVKQEEFQPFSPDLNPAEAIFG
jgi:hypothetical protein